MHENSSELYEQIRRNLAFLRKEHEIKQTTIAKELKTEQSMISQYETGKRVPSLDLLEKWCKCLNVFLLSNCSQPNLQRRTGSTPANGRP